MSGSQLFVVFALASQVLLVVFFATHLLRRPGEAAAGRVVYGLALVALPLAVFLAATTEPWYLIAALLLYMAWAALGTYVDVLRPIQWREPPKWSVIVPYAVLLMAALLFLWVPLWSINWSAWLVFGVLFAIHTTMNLASHYTARRAVAQEH